MAGGSADQDPSDGTTSNQQLPGGTNRTLDHRIEAPVVAGALNAPSTIGYEDSGGGGCAERTLDHRTRGLGWWRVR